MAIRRFELANKLQLHAATLSSDCRDTSMSIDPYAIPASPLRTASAPPSRKSRLFVCAAAACPGREPCQSCIKIDALLPTEAAEWLV